jgi:soluble lytic murein transglycosylase-like protein
MDYKPAIILAALGDGIDPAVALAVAHRESGTRQFRTDGSLVVGKAGEIGIFQIMPSTAPGVDLADPQTNINTGVAYLAQLRSQFGAWPLALAAYNWGPGNVQAASKGLKTVPSSVSQYVSGVLGPGQLSVSVAGSMTPAKVAVGITFGAAVLLLALR